MNATLTNNSQPITTTSERASNHNILSKNDQRNPANWVTDSLHPDAISGLPEDALELLKPEAYQQMIEGTIPNLISICEALYFTFANVKKDFNALQFVPVLQKLNRIDPLSAARFLSNPKTNHVLVQNSLIKVVLIHWKPGHYSSIHGHAAGGCVFKVLSGSLEEKRYSPDENQFHLATSTVYKGSMAYIDDTLAHHAVGNPFDLPAISLHVYKPGMH